VSLAHVVGPFFITNPDEMFSLDRFHPSAAGYKRTAKALLPSLLSALGGAEELPFGHARPEIKSSDSATDGPRGARYWWFPPIAEGRRWRPTGRGCATRAAGGST